MSLHGLFVALMEDVLMFMYSIRTVVPFLAVSLLGMAGAQATTCMVMGERSARVHSAEGDKSPVFLSQSCESLRLLSGQAMVSWAGRDGKPHFVPVGPNGVAQLPSPGAEERSASSVWAELGSKRDAQRSAYLRGVGTDKGSRLHVPEAGLSLNARPASAIKLWVKQEEGERLLLEISAPADGVVVLKRDLLASGFIYQLEWVPQASPGAGSEPSAERWLLRPLPAAEQHDLDEHLRQVMQAVADPTQQALMQAMVYEQLKLPLNMRLSLSTDEVRAMVGVGSAAQP